MDRYLVLENGKVFKGKAFGADKDVIAEIVFTTSMTGYFETLTDESYTGQAVIQTFPLIGNYGIITEDAESKLIGPSAYIVRERCEKPSNFRCEYDLDSYLKERGIPGIYGIDTRTLTRIIRESGVMNGMITDDPAKADFEKIKAYRIIDPVGKVSTKEIYEVSEPDPKFKVGLFDFGLKDNIARCLAKRGCQVMVLPCKTTPQQIKDMNLDGVFLSNGPGDPEDNTEIIENLKEIIKFNIPTMGICLGHQLLALANGFKTEKLKYGHRGANQPVKCLENGVTYISSQNHGYAVVNDSVDREIADLFFVNVNDGTNEGLIYKNAPIITVQFHPEACGGPKDSEFLFGKFIEMMEARR